MVRAGSDILMRGLKSVMRRGTGFRNRPSHAPAQKRTALYHVGQRLSSEIPTQIWVRVYLQKVAGPGTESRFPFLLNILTPASLEHADNAEGRPSPPFLHARSGFLCLMLNRFFKASAGAPLRVLCVRRPRTAAGCETFRRLSIRGYSRLSSTRRGCRAGARCSRACLTAGTFSHPFV